MQEGFIDEESGADEHFAVVYAPRRGRGRFAENCVQVMDSEAAARAGSAPAEQRFAAVVMGPSRSSEGLRLYYLVRWLD